MISDLRDIDKVMLNEIRIANEPYVVENIWEKIEIEPINVVIVANGKE